jgi:3-oxoacid CoA-transferase subunit B
MSFFNQAESFSMIRGGHIDLSVLGAFQVSEKGDLANWALPDKQLTIGGSMDLAEGARRLIAVMNHTTKEGEYRIVKECSYPLTALASVNLIVTDIAVMEVTDQGLVLKESAPGWTPEEVQSLTEPQLTIDPDCQEITLL